MAVLAPATDAVARTDLQQLQGVWTTVAGLREARFLVAGRRFTFEFVGGDLYMGTFDVADGRMDMHVEEGPTEHIYRITRCIYQIEGGVLRWCPGRPGSDRRPAAFPDVDDPRHVSLVFRRVSSRSR